MNSYIRKASALFCLQKYEEALETVMCGLKLEYYNSDLKKLRNQLQSIILTKSSPDIQKFQNLEQWLSKDGGDSSKLQLRYYKESYRGVHA